MTSASRTTSPVLRPVLPPVVERTLMPAGFAAIAGSAGIKASGRPDVAIVTVTTPAPATAAATFTRNLVAAAPVRLSRAHLAATAGRARAVIVTAGCANAATGAGGDADQARVANALASAIGCPIEETLHAATGLIGTTLPVERIEQAVGALVGAGLAATEDALGNVVAAMMTTDRRPKRATVELLLPAADGGGADVAVRVTGIVKGVGMIHPNMATMIAVLLTDAAVDPATLGAMLRRAVRTSFDQLTVDGDTSTNDTVFALASGASRAAPLVRDDGIAAERLEGAIAAVCRSLARQQAADGEGATTLVTCTVTGAADETDARAVSRAVVGGTLVKAAIRGRDPNWGRVAGAAGAARRPDGSQVRLVPERLRISLCGTAVFAGEPLAFDAAALRRAMDVPEVTIDVDLGLGDGAAEAWGCDLTEDYVRENAEYST